jgi:Cu(I)/Ag(I) efflux system membrane fusion protein
MDYIPVYANATSSASVVAGQAEVHLTPGVEQRIGVKVADAHVRDLFQSIRAAARVAYDPQLYSAALEHREAREFLKQMQDADSKEQAQATVRASKLRLRQMGLSDEQIDEISSPGYDVSSLIVGSRSGRLWVYADVSDNQVGLVHSGQTVKLTSPAMPGQPIKGVVRGIDPVVNPETRTVRVRINAENPEGQLRPGVYVNALIRASLGQALAVPENAVIDTGARQLVYVQTQPGIYEPRAVRLGRQAEGFREILEGLKAGEKVVSSAGFLIDSESRIQAAVHGAGQ